VCRASLETQASPTLEPYQRLTTATTPNSADTGSVYLRAILRSKLSVAIAKVALIKALFFIQCAALAKLVGDIHENPPQTLVPAPTLKTAR
jgi:hypothetical protein